MAAMRQAVGVPVTAKHRLGVDEMEDYRYVARFCWRGWPGWALGFLSFTLEKPT